MLTESFVAVMAMIAATILDPGVYFAMNANPTLLGDTVQSASQAVNGFGFQVSPDTLSQTAQRVGEDRTDQAMEDRLAEAYIAIRGGTPVAEVTERCGDSGPESSAELEASIDYVPLIGWFSDGISLGATAVMRCGG
jgi:hypothetical protein